ncbi:Minor histocompatibility antigen H13 [Seminavis robusta]|uniref:Minor histocompatibility antigen H13 n=1 Tax=Seminavis robusta TaxID=568900 RepID=A0A9N8ERM2_9STRA|nr:Minor histocompatibility antigen H13 [Seminavis robusta]|eukprot:Sro1758_g295760.1 Minor histocompatibility antigen H13 (419) ;mRNA; f:13061-14790
MTEAEGATKTEAPAPAPPSPPRKQETNVVLWLSYLTIVGLWGASQVVLIPYVANCISLVAAILYVACHWSLALREVPPEGNDDGTNDGGSTPPAVETLSASDAYQFPLVGSCSLFGLYCAFKYLDKDLVNLLIGGYFCLAGCLALTATGAPALLTLAGGNKAFLEKSYGFKKSYQHPAFLNIVLGKEPLELDIEFQTVDAIAIIPSMVLCYFYFMSKHWTLNNILGICFCLQGIQRFSLGTYKIGAILLVGLFFYDIFWVFGTDVMVTVAKSLDGPIKILFPRSLTPSEETGKIDLALLGLGDIVIPGFFLAILLRFDAHQANLPTSYTDVHASFPKPYFHSALVFYILGMSTTMAVMIFFEAAQPALLYLVPACLISSLGCAAIRGEMKELLAYSEEPDEEEEEAEGTKEEESKKDK